MNKYTYTKKSLNNAKMQRKNMTDCEAKLWYFLRAKRVEIPSSITGCEFYRKMGYDFKNGIKELDDEKHFRLEKFR